MTEIAVIKCDGCDSEIIKEGKMPRHWLTVDLQVGDNPTKDTVHVDSFACLARYANRKEKQQNGE